MTIRVEHPIGEWQGIEVAPGRLVGQSAPMSRLTRILALSTGQTVLDSRVFRERTTFKHIGDRATPVCRSINGRTMARPRLQPRGRARYYRLLRRRCGPSSAYCSRSRSVAQRSASWLTASNSHRQRT